MERDTEESSSRGSEQRERLVLGYFLQLYGGFDITGGSRPQPSHAFLSSCPQGNDLKQDKFGAFDETLNFLGQDVYIVGSSNGFLLCTIIVEEKRQFVICNPVSREFRVIRESDKPYGYVDVAFICRGNYDGISSMEMVNYEIFLASTSYEMTNVLELQIFSSQTDEWKNSCIESQSPFFLIGNPGPATVLGELVCWIAGPGGHFVSYNRCSERVEVLELPHPDEGDHISAEDVVLSDSLCASNGRLYYACSLAQRLEVWVLQDCVGGRADWNLQYSVSHRMMIQHNHDLKKKYRCCQVKCLHPQIPNLVIVFMGSKMCCYDMVVGKLEELRTDFYALAYVSFPYEWPSNPLLDLSNVPNPLGQSLN